MQINKSNYQNEFKNLPAKLPDALKEGHELLEAVTENFSSWDMYNGDKDIKDTIDLYFDKFGQWKASLAPAPKKSPAKAQKSLSYDISGEVIHGAGGKKEHLSTSLITSGNLADIAVKYAKKHNIEYKVTGNLDDNKVVVYYFRNDEAEKMRIVFSARKNKKGEAGAPSSELDNYIAKHTLHTLRANPGFKISANVTKAVQQASKPVQKKGKAVQKTANPAQNAANEAPKTKPTPKQSAPKKEVDEVKDHSYHLTVAQRLAKRFLNYGGKSVEQKTLVNFIRTLQKAIAERRVAKNTTSGKLLKEIEGKARKAYNLMQNEGTAHIKIAFTDVFEGRLKELATSKPVWPSIALVKRYIGITGPDKPTLPKVERLVKAIQSAFKRNRIAFNDPYKAYLKEIQETLEGYLDNRRSTLLISEQSLQGLSGLGYVPAEKKSEEQPTEITKADRERLCGYTFEQQVPSQPQTSFQGLNGASGYGTIGGNRTHNNQFASLLAQQQTEDNYEVEDGLPEDLAELMKPREIQGKVYDNLPTDLGAFLGAPEAFEYALVLRGDPGAGKSSLLYQLMNLFADQGLTVGYASLEMHPDSQLAKGYEKRFVLPQYIDPESPMRRIYKAAEAPDGIQTIRRMAKHFDVVAIDSFSKLKAKPEEFDRLRKEFPTTLFLAIFQSTSQGTARGSVSIEYDGGAVLHVHRPGIAKFEKNRYETDRSRDMAFDVHAQKMIPVSETNL